MSLMKQRTGVSGWGRSEEVTEKTSGHTWWWKHSNTGKIKISQQIQLENSKNINRII